MSQLFDRPSDIQPVWNVIPQFFKYPFKQGVWPTLAFISVGSLLTMIPVLGIVAWLLLWAMLFKLSYEILSSTASGHMNGPPAVMQMSGGIMFKHIGLMGLMIMGYVLIAGLTASPLLSVLLGGFVLLALPAAIMTLAMTQSLFAALNPGTWVTIMRISGAAYLLTSVFLLLMIMSRTWVDGLLLPLVGQSVALFGIVSWAITGYFMAASFHLMGYLLYQHHVDLGIETSIAPNQDGKENEYPLITQATELVREGRAAEAVNRLKGEIMGRGAEPEVHEFYRKLLRNRGDRGGLADHGAVYIPNLIHAQENVDRAVDVAEESYSARRDFQLSQAADVLPLARRAFDRRRYKLVLKLSNGFAKRYPKHSDLPELYFLVAQSLIESGGSSERSKEMMRQLVERFPDHPRIDDMRLFERRLTPG